jgi:hypothetical protein
MFAEKDVVFSRRAKFYFVTTGLQLAINFIVVTAKVWFYYLTRFFIGFTQRSRENKGHNDF